MKIHFDLPWGGVLDIDRTKQNRMDAEDKVMLACVAAILSAFFMALFIATRG